MIKVILYTRGDLLCGFEISGHAAKDIKDKHGEIVCAAVSSAAIMTANTVTDVICDKAEVKSDDGYLILTVKDTEKCATVLDGFKLHICALQSEYPDIIKVTIKAE